MQSATEWLNSSHVNDWCERQRKLRSMCAAEYSTQLSELIDGAGEYLTDADSQKVLLDAFTLLRDRLGVKIESKLVIRRES